jgi:drug/metabolite transporter (DMT)-like permease
MLLSVGPLLAGFPNKAVLLSGPDFGYMMGVAGTSFVAQLLVTRGLQRCQAAKATAMSFTQVRQFALLAYLFLKP